jgi:hypothetical protein
LIWPRLRAVRAISSRRNFTLRLRSRSLAPAAPAISVIRRIARVSTRTPSPSNVLSVGWWMLVSTTVVSTRIRRPGTKPLSCAIATMLS